MVFGRGGGLVGASMGEDSHPPRQGDDGIRRSRGALAEGPDQPLPMTVAKRAAMELPSVPVGERSEGWGCLLAGSRTSVQGKMWLGGLRQLLWEAR